MFYPNKINSNIELLHIIQHEHTFTNLQKNEFVDEKIKAVRLNILKFVF